MEQEFSFKELYDVFLKATYIMEINGKTYQPGETVALFDKIALASITGVSRRVTAHGGFDDRAHVVWETMSEANIQFAQGVFSRTQFGLLTNAHLLKFNQGVLNVPVREMVESDEDKTFYLSYACVGSPFVYKEETGELVTVTQISDKVFQAPAAFCTYVVDYSRAYATPQSSILNVGSSLSKGSFSLIGKTKTKDDITGQVRAAIIEIPKFELMSNLSISLGKNAHPVVAHFKGKALPFGERGSASVINVFFLEDDIDSDIQ